MIFSAGFDAHDEDPLANCELTEEDFTWATEIGVCVCVYVLVFLLYIRFRDKILFYVILYYTILYYAILNYTILYYAILYCTILFYTMLY